MEADPPTDSGENNDENVSFEDSDRFDEMSLCSWASDPEIVCGDWAGWRRTTSTTSDNSSSKDIEHGVETLVELCSKLVAIHVPFETVEKTHPNLPEDLQLRIAFWSFPQSDDNIRLYSCLANGSAEEFFKGEQLFRAKAVVDPLQIGFHLSGSIRPYSHVMMAASNDGKQLHTHKSAVAFGRGHVTSCSCTCCPSVAWCCHIVALCLHRIHQPHSVSLRPPVSESLSRLQRNQLQKFSQYLISELPLQLLPYAQSLLDQLLSSRESEINKLPGAPDPTAGPAAEDKTQWSMDEKALCDNIRKMLSKFCGPGPFVLEEVYSLQFASTAPPTAAEWSNLLRPLTSHEPEGMWNLLSIVRELFKLRDSNAVELLRLLTQECLSFDQIVVWWFSSRSQSSGRIQPSSRNSDSNYRNNINTASTEMTKHACGTFCDELTLLWRLACLDPALTPTARQKLKENLEQLHGKTVEKTKNARYLGERIHSYARAVENFPGFKIAIEACSVDWSSMKLTSPKNSVGHVILEDDACSSYSNEKWKSVGDLEEDIHTMVARVEALQVHGYPEAKQAAVDVAVKIISQAEKRCVVEDHDELPEEEAECFIRATVVEASSLCNVLLQDPIGSNLAFNIGMLGLEAPRKPCQSKALEVKLAHQESVLVGLLKQLSLGPAELAVVRERARLLCEGKPERGNAVLPLKLAIFLFQVLTEKSERSQEDKELGLKTGLTALRMKSDVLETEYPMLCEGIRRQRGELAIVLFEFAKDNQVHLQQIKDCLLDKKRYRVESRVNGIRRHGGKRRRNKTCSDSVKAHRGRFGVPGQRRSPNDDDNDTFRPIVDYNTRTSKSPTCSEAPSTFTDSSESRQSSWSSCLSDDLSAHDEFRASRGGDSGRDSDNDAVGAAGVSIEYSSRGNYSEGEIPGEHSPGEEVVTVRLERSSSGSTGTEGEVSGGSGSGGSGSGIGSPSLGEKRLEGACTDAVPQNNESRIAQDNSLNVGVDDSQNSIAQDAQHSVLPDDNATSDTAKVNKGFRSGKFCQGKRYDNKSRKNNTKGRPYRGDNRFLEAEAHFTFELAKKVLLLACGGKPSSSLFGQAESANVTQSNCNRSLQLCAFELGLFALRLHNVTCSNWLSRTYSAHVSWISAQALELGNIAVAILLEQWQGHLTPSEVASIADRASKSNDPIAVQKAARLALSCLSMAHTLNPDHISRALTQCKEQSIELLEHACLAVESAARGGGVYPEVLFEIAKHWEYLYNESLPPGNDDRRSASVRGSDDPHDSDKTPAISEPRPAEEHPPCATGTKVHLIPEPFLVRVSRMGLGSRQSKPYGYRGNANYGLFVPLPTPEQLVQQQVSQQVQHLIESYQCNMTQPNQVSHQLASAYRVGMLALENLGRRTPDDHPNSMFAKNPPYSSDIRWLCSIANKVGTSSLQQFCRACVSAIHSPFVLHELALEAAGLMAKSNCNSSQIAFHLRAPYLSPMVQKCLTKYTHCVQHTLQGLPKSEYAEFVELITHARGAYCMAPGGMTQFNELLQNIRRNASKKKDLWQKVATALAQYQK